MDLKSEASKTTYSVGHINRIGNTGRE